MKNTKKIKFYIGIFYLIFIGLFLYYFFSIFSLQEVTSYDFIKNNRDYFYDFRQSNLLLLASIFILFTIIWVLAAGFGSPIAIFAGFIFGKWIGTLIVVISLFNYRLNRYRVRVQIKVRSKLRLIFLRKAVFRIVGF